MASGLSTCSEKNSDMGDVDIYIDDRLQGTVSANNGSRTAQQVLFRTDALAAGVHTLKGVKKNGEYMLTDAFRVLQGDGSPAGGEAPAPVIVGNSSPVVSFAFPADGASVEQGSVLSVTVNADDPDGSVDNVRLFVGGDFVRQENVDAYEWGEGDSILQSLTAGVYQLTAVATDDAGDSTEETITISITQ